MTPKKSLLQRIGDGIKRNFVRGVSIGIIGLSSLSMGGCRYVFPKLYEPVPTPENQEGYIHPNIRYPFEKSSRGLSLSERKFAAYYQRYPNQRPSNNPSYQTNPNNQTAQAMEERNRIEQEQNRIAEDANISNGLFNTFWMFRGLQGQGTIKQP